MVSGFFTSPKDHERIFSGEAMPMRMASKCSSGVNCLNRSSSDFILFLPLGPLELDVDTERSDFLPQHVERLRHAGIDRVLALDDGLVHLGAALYVVGLDGEHFLQRVGSAVGFERPHFHLAET